MMAKVLLGDVAKERKEVCKGSKAGLPIVGLEHLTPGEITLPGCLPAARYGQQGDAGQYPQGAFLLLLLAGR